jgi:hypothetical protein
LDFAPSYVRASNAPAMLVLVGTVGVEIGRHKDFRQALRAKGSFTQHED